MKTSSSTGSGRGIFSWLLLAAGVAFVITPFVLANATTSGRVEVSLPMYAGMVLGGLILAGVGLLSGRRTSEDDLRDYRHAYPMLALVGLIIIGVTGARQIFVPPTYGQYGHYRGAAPAEARVRKPRHLGQQQCKECHDDIGKLHDKDAHGRVACETCHGPGHKHKADQNNKLTEPRSQEGCLVCHRRLLARPPAFPQIRVADHYRLVGVKNMKLACVKCHSPHEPLYMDRDLRKARLHPLVHRCRDCHPGRTNRGLQRPKTHPAIFECSYCHKKRVADFASRKHKKLRCSTCHIFVKETPFAGRIVRDTDRRFCLLCHRKASFRSASAAPGIDPKTHMDAPKTACIECHSDAIHGDISAPTREPAQIPRPAPGAPATTAPRPAAMAPRPAAMAPRPAAMAPPAQRPAPRTPTAPAGSMETHP